MIAWHIGTMGFSYPGWRGVFYPREMEAPRFLTYYSRIFNSLEIDSTFYGVPRKSTVLGWKFAVPHDFTFTLKTPNAITHQAEMLGSVQLFMEFIDRVRFLEGKLGVILLQFPPSFHSERLPSLAELLSRLPSDVRCAVEVRHHSWYTPGLAMQTTRELLRDHNVCWAAIEYPGISGRIVPTSDFLYIRWIGQHGTFAQHDAERLDREANMLAWNEKIKSVESQVQAVFGYFNNDYAGYAAGSAQRFKRLVGLPVVDSSQPVQGQLF